MPAAAIRSFTSSWRASVARKATWLTQTGSPLPGRDLALPVGLLTDAVDIEEREAAAIARVEEEMTEEAARARLAAHLGVQQRHAHELVVEAHRRVDVAAGEGNVVDRRLGHESPLHSDDRAICVIGNDATPARSEGPS